MHAQLEDLYSLKLPLGRNLAGAVWQAETLKGGKPAAVAVLDLEDLSDPDLRKRAATRFRRDMGLLKKVNHPHVVRVLDVGRTRSGRPFAAMEHVDGESLSDWLDQQRNGADRVRVASALLDGLEAAHRAGVAHGDLEPGNILMTNDGMPKLIGFGLNRTLARQSHPEWREESGLAKSIAFRAPEEAQGMGGHRADLYATGVLLHLICSGELPAYGLSTLRENAPRLPAGLIAVIERALIEDPLERHPNTTAMRRAWLEAAMVAREAIEGATTGFRALSERPMRPLSAPPVGVLLAPPDEDEDEDEVDVGRPSLMPVGVALAEEDGDPSGDDLTSLSPEQVNVLGARSPIAAREMNERFSDPPPDPGMRISLSDAFEEGDPLPDAEMRISLSDVMEDQPAAVNPAPPRPVPRRPKARPSTPIHAAPAAPAAESGGSKMWIALVAAVAALGAGIWFMQEPSDPGHAALEPTQTTRSGSEAESPIVDPATETNRAPDREVVPEAPTEALEIAEPEVSSDPIIVALRLHGLPPGAVASIDGESVAVDDDSIAFPGDGNEHTITVSAEGFETWERSLATATPLDLLVVNEALTPAPSDSVEPPVMAAAMRPTIMRASMANPVMRASMMTPTMSTMRSTMRPGLARDPGF